MARDVVIKAFTDNYGITHLGVRWEDGPVDELLVACDQVWVSRLDFGDYTVTCFRCIDSTKNTMNWIT